MFKKLLKNVKDMIIPDIMEMVAIKYAELKDIISRESKRLNDTMEKLDSVKTFLVEQQREIDEIKKLTRPKQYLKGEKRGR